MGKTSSTVKDRWNAKAYDEIKVRVSKGQKNVVQTHAAARGESVNGFIGRAIQNQIERDTAAAPADAEQSATVADQKEE